MTSRERVLTALRLGQPDMVPFFDNVNQQARRMVMGREDFDDLDFAREIHFDALDFKGFTPPFAAKTVNGAVVEGLIRTKDDLLRLLLPEINDTYLAPARAFADKYGDSGLALFFRTRFGPSFILQSMGFERFSYAIFDDPGFIETFADIFAEWVIRLMEKARGIGFDFAWFADDVAFKTSLMFSPEVFRQIFVPRIRLILRELRGMPSVYHSDGNISEILPDLADLGINGLNPIESGAMDIERFKREYGGKICPIGNVDLHYTLTSGTVQEVWEEVRRLITTIGKGGGYIIASSNSITHYCKKENVAAMRDAIDYYRKY